MSAITQRRCDDCDTRRRVWRRCDLAPMRGKEPSMMRHQKEEAGLYVVVSGKLREPETT